VTDFYEMRRNYESRKAQRFLLWTDRMTKRIAAACIISGAILLGIMLVKAIGRG
jgi:hypothetical protein